jgi:hypothetical protein
MKQSTGLMPNTLEDLSSGLEMKAGVADVSRKFLHFKQFDRRRTIQGASIYRKIKLSTGFE